MAQPGKATIEDFHGAILRNEHAITARKSIVICGVTRGGTSFAASVFAQLGVPFSRGLDDPAPRRHHENQALVGAFQAEDHSQIRKIAAEFSERFPVWGWKLPAIHQRIEAVGELVPNPHFVVVFKEPLSVAFRRNDLKGVDMMKGLRATLKAYLLITDSIAATKHPTLLVSYDRAMAQLPAFLKEAARFAGIPSFEEAAVIAEIREDARLYSIGGEYRLRRLMESARRQ